MRNWVFSAYHVWFLWFLVDVYAMLYAKMFHGYDKMKHYETWGVTKFDIPFSKVFSHEFIEEM